MSLYPGDRVDRYEVLELLGSGGMGEVYRARDRKLARLVALKILHARPGAGTHGAERLLREARAAAALSHANVLAVFDVGEVQEPEALRGLAYIAMELVVGRSLRPYVGDEGVPMDRRVSWLRDVALALAAAHQAGIVHRDVKLENAMIRNDGAVKVLDFGIARRAGVALEAWSSLGAHAVSTADTEPVSGSSTLSSFVGTPLYMAPEQLRGEALDGRADQFAWGVMAYELVTGKSPWSGRALSEAVALASQILDRVPPAPRDVDARVPDAVSRAIARALSKRIDDRFTSMQEVADALRGAAEERTEPHYTMSPARRRRGLVASGALIAALAGGGWLARRAQVNASAEAAAAGRLSANAGATAAYHAGVQAFRDASLGPALRQLGRAVELDSLFAAAHLRLAMTKLVAGWEVTSAELQPARDARATLGAHDLTLLRAIEPLVLEPPDFEESLRRFDAAARAYPADAELALDRAFVLDKLARPERALEAVDAAIALDPTLAVALMEKGQLLLETGNASGAFEVYRKCTKISPGTTSCLADMAAVEANEGQCEELLATSRRLIAVAPDEPAPYHRLAEALAGTGEPFDVVRAALRQRLEHEPASDRRASEASSEAALAILEGDFPRALRTYAEMDAQKGSDFNENDLFDSAYTQMLLELELGQPARATDLARGYLRQRTAWPGQVHDSSLAAYAVERSAGAITASDLDAQRREWLAHNEGESAWYRWITAYAGTTTTPDEARAALAAKPEGVATNPLFMPPDQSEPIGRAYALAGSSEEGTRYLTAASSSCAVLVGTAAVFSTWAAYELGRALEARGDAAGACRAYERVLTRWGKATPASTTAAKARARRAELGCGS